MKKSEGAGAGGGVKIRISEKSRRKCKIDDMKIVGKLPREGAKAVEGHRCAARGEHSSGCRDTREDLSEVLAEPC